MPARIEPTSERQSGGCCKCCCSCLSCFTCCRKRRNSDENGQQTADQEDFDNDSKIAFQGDLPKDLGPGKNISLIGYVLPNCSRFAVNLTCGRTTTTDIGFHFNPRLQLRYVARNSRFQGQWGEEETTSPIKFPSNIDKFTINIFIGKTEFFVTWNGRYVCSYKYRIPITKLHGIHVEGHVDIKKVDYFDQRKFPDLEDMQQSQLFKITPVLPSNYAHQQQEPISDTPLVNDTPVTVLLPKGFQREWQLEIYGRVKILPHSFHINLQEGAHQWPHPIIHLHLNPRFSVGLGEPLFIRNAWIDGAWGQEERTPGFQFSPGSPFTMAIRRGEEHFSVWINGQLSGEFKFRSNPDKINTLYIQGDLFVYKLMLIDYSEQ